MTRFGFFKLTASTFIITTLGCTFAVAPIYSQTQTSKKSPFQKNESPDKGNSSTSKELIDKLQTALSNTQWTGSFTVDGDDSAPKPESYEIQKVEYQGNDQWILTANIAYGKNNITVPIPLAIKWAGRTPVITVDQLTIPTMGTFDARVLIRRGKYSGTWAHGKIGGHLFGKYEKLTPVSKPKKSTNDQPGNR